MGERLVLFSDLTKFSDQKELLILDRFLQHRATTFAMAKCFVIYRLLMCMSSVQSKPSMFFLSREELKLMSFLFLAKSGHSLYNNSIFFSFFNLYFSLHDQQSKLYTEFYEIFRLYLSQMILKTITFWLLSGDSCCPTAVAIDKLFVGHLLVLYRIKPFGILLNCKRYIQLKRNSN